MAGPVFGDTVRCARLLFVANHPRNSNHVRATRNTIDSKIEFLLLKQFLMAVDTCTYIIPVLCGTVIAVILDNADAIQNLTFGMGTFSSARETTQGSSEERQNTKKKRFESTENMNDEHFARR